MSNKTYKKIERAPSHAGRILKSGFIDQYNLNIETVAELLGVTRVHLSRIINGHSPVTSDIAIKLEMLTETPANQWLSLQAQYDAFLLEKDKGFQRYKEAIGKWILSSLDKTPVERRKDEKTRELVKKASILAKQLGQKAISK